MEPDETPMSRPPAPKADPTPTPSEAELSRIAREAVRQPADPRLDKQLERMGLTDAPAAHPTAASSVAPTTGPVAEDPRFADVERRLRRVESMAWVLLAIVVVLAVAVIFLLAR
jgi:uncharacterized membrane protein